MATFKKNATNQILFILTKSGDGSHALHANVSQITAAGPSYIGVAAGSAVAGKGSISKVASLVKSGVFRQTLKAAECNFDMGMYMFGATSCAAQFIPITFETDNDVTVYSRVLATYNLFNSRVTSVVGTASDLASKVTIAVTTNLGSQVWANANGVATKSAAQRANSRAYVCQSLASDAQSAATAAYSRAVLGTSAARAASSRALICQSLASDTYSQTVLGHSAATAATTQATKSYSAAVLGQSLASDVYSLLTKTESGVNVLQSRVTSTVVTASDLVSKVWADANATATKSAAQQANARALVCQSLISDVQSAIAAGSGGATPSQVWYYAKGTSTLAAAKAGASRALICQSLISDVQSALAAGSGGATPSQVWYYAKGASTLASAKAGASRALICQSLASDAQSAATAAYSRAVLGTSAARSASSRALLCQSLASDTYSQTVLTHSAATAGTAQAAKSYSAAVLCQSLISDVASQQIAAIPELTGVPSATPTPNQAIMFLYMGQRNKIKSTSATTAVYNNAGTVVCSAALSDNSVTFSRAKMA